MSRVDSNLLLAPLRQGLAGALGGMVVFALFETPMRRMELGDLIDPVALSAILWVGTALGAVISGFLVLADELSTGRLVRMLWRGALAAVMGGAIGSFFYFAANCFFGLLLLVTLGMAGIFARTVGWCVMGLGIGIASGIASRSFRRVRQGCWAGLAGGFLSGLVFDLLAAAAGTGTATLPRLVGFTTLGAFCGIATAVVEQLERVAWITFLTGAREGRQVILHRDPSVFGRDELADVPLFGDHRIERRHAELALEPTPVIREVASAALLRVDGRPVREAVLHDGALVEIGKHRFRFHHRYAAATQHAAAVFSGVAVPAPFPGRPPAPPPYPLVPPGSSVPPSAVAGPAAPPSVSAPWSMAGPLRLRVVAGPGAFDPAGAVVPLESSPVTIGRETDNTLSIPDAKISRHHLRLDCIDGDWVVTDLGSRNGTHLNGVPVTRAGLAAGDTLALGETRIVVEAAHSPVQGSATATTLLE